MPCPIQQQANIFPSFCCSYTCRIHLHCLSCLSPDSDPDGLQPSLPHLFMLRHGLPYSASTSYMLHFCVLVRAPFSSVQAFCHFWLMSCSLGWTILELRGGDPWKSTMFTVPLFSPEWSPIGILPSRSLNRPKFALLQSRNVIPLFWFFPPLSSTISWSLQLWLSLIFTSLTSSPLFISIRSSRDLVVSSFTCVGHLSLMHSRNLLNCLCPAVLPFQQVLW